MAVINQPRNLLPSTFAVQGNRNDIPADNDGTSGLASYQKGFPPITQRRPEDGGVAPDRMDFNGILYTLSQFPYFQQSGGIFTWSSTLNYSPPNIVFYNGVFYSSVVDSGAAAVGTGVVEPGTNEAVWKPLLPYIGGMTSEQISALVDQKVKAAIEASGGGSATYMGVTNMSFIAGANATNLGVHVTSDYAYGDVWWSAAATYNAYVNGNIVGSVGTYCACTRQGGKGYYWGYYSSASNVANFAVNIKKGDTIQVNCVNIGYSTFQRGSIIATLN